MTEIWLAIRLLFSRKTLGQGNTKVALVGLVIGVACLVVAMAVMSGYEMTLRQSVVDVVGHLQVLRSSAGAPDWDDLEQRIYEMDSRITGGLRFVFLEAVLAHKGETVGVTIQGVDSEKWQQVLNFSRRVESGSLDISSSEIPKVLIGKVLAQRLNLNIGDKFRVVVPIADSLDPHRFSRRMGQFEVTGILDFGKYDWNERYLIANLRDTQELAQIKDRLSGLIFSVSDADLAREVYYNLSSKLGFGYIVRDWKELNENIFQATQGEKVIIFFVVFIIVLVAAFSVASSFYVNVFQRYPDIAILKTLGLRQNSLVRIYGLQGLMLGVVGTIFGYLLGITLCYLFVWGQKVFQLMPGSVYRLAEIQVDIRWIDTLAILGSTLFICLLASIFPARRGARLNAVEGLRYE